MPQKNSGRRVCKWSTIMPPLIGSQLLFLSFTAGFWKTRRSDSHRAGCPVTLLTLFRECKWLVNRVISQQLTSQPALFLHIKTIARLNSGDLFKDLEMRMAGR